MTSEQVLRLLLEESELPYLDRWFASLSQRQRFSLAVQKRLWDQLREVLTRATGIAAEDQAPNGGWQAYRALFLRNFSQLIKPSQSLDPHSCGIPRWLRGEWEERCRLEESNPGWQSRFLSAQHRASPRYVRFSGSKEGVSLRREWGERLWVVPGAYGCPGFEGEGAELSAAMKKGLVEIQDASSQLCLSGLELRAGQKVWDVCAGNGGKTLLIAEELRNKGVLVATEISASKLTLLKQRVRQHGWQNVRALGWAGEASPDFGHEINGSGGFDRVVVDAPCSASGTWRRDPEARYRLDAAGLLQLQAHQRRLLGLGWAALKPGGRLAYVTCSWLPSENEKLIGQFGGSNACRIVSQRLWGLPDADANTLFAAVLEKPRIT